MTTQPSTEFGTATDTSAPGWTYLSGQHKPELLLTLAQARAEANERASRSADVFNRRMSDETLAQMIEDERAAQDAEAQYLAALGEWHEAAEWGGENAIEQVAEYFTEDRND